MLRFCVLKRNFLNSLRFEGQNTKDMYETEQMTCDRDCGALSEEKGSALGEKQNLSTHFTFTAV